MSSSASGRRYSTPIATYRLQLHRGFGFAEAAAALPYLDRLGISHLYLSPFFTAAPGSEHGYDVYNHNEVNPELGGLSALYDLGAELAERDMGLIADIVPNHVGIGWQNPWWRDVLRYGQRSRYAAWFDIDWEALPQVQRGVLVVPLLGRPFGEALEAGELTLAVKDGELAVCYFDHALPLAPESYRSVCELPPLTLRTELSDPGAFTRLVDALEIMGQGERESAEAALETWRGLLHDEPAVRQFVTERAAALNGSPGDPASFDALEAVLGAQRYRLADWRVAGEEINYRRFFDVNGLAGIRVERDDVFEEVHRLLFELVGRGIVTGVRVDHVDGLYAPERYLARLAAGLAAVAPGAAHIPVYVEKILQPGEDLPDGWRTDGTTGYEFAANVDGLLIDPAGRRGLDAGYRRFAGPLRGFERTAYEARREVVRTAFAGETTVLGYHLHSLARRHRLHRDHTLNALRDAIRGTLACFPVYRTYLPDDQAPPGQVPPGQAEITRAIDQARLRDLHISAGALAFLREVLLLEGDIDPEERLRRAEFRRRFQQLSSPVMAKGIEDTAFFRYNRLLSVNEVGASPAELGRELRAVHAFLARRAARHATALSAGSTHDTKRSEDIRARLDALSEVPAEWAREALAWHRLNARHRSQVDGEPAPSPNTEYYLYQTLVGAWPPDVPGECFTARMIEHLRKALREAKQETSWTRPNEEYEAACARFVTAILDPELSPAFNARIERFAGRLARAGELNSLVALVLRCTAPGVPDFYQGTEFPNFRLTDPDNRHDVDFAAAAMTRAPVPAGNDAFEALKPWLTRELLALRARRRDLFRDGTYEPLRSHGPAAGRVFAFSRRHGAKETIVAVPVRCAMDAGVGRCFPADYWAGTRITTATAGTWRDALTDDSFDGSVLACDALFARYPFAVLERARQ